MAIGNFFGLPKDSFFHVLDYLYRSREFISLASTCQTIHIFFKTLPINTHFQEAVTRRMEKADIEKNDALARDFQIPLCPRTGHLYGRIFHFKTRHLDWTPKTIRCPMLYEDINTFASFFPPNAYMTVHNSFRNSLTSRSQAELSQLATRYWKCAANNTQEFQEVKDSLKTKLEVEKTNFEINFTEVESKLLEHSVTHCCFARGINQHCEFEKKLHSICKEIKKIEEKLENLDTCAKHEARKLGDLFYEISLEVTDKNQFDRFVKLSSFTAKSK